MILNDIRWVCWFDICLESLYGLGARLTCLSKENMPKEKGRYTFLGVVVLFLITIVDYFGPRTEALPF